MDIVHGGRMEWGENLAAHRQGGMAHKVLFEGEQGAADNYCLVLANESSTYYSPRHRHAWDQVRFCLEGAVPIGKNLAVEAGEVAYFPEGVHYGPQEGGPDRIELLLQFGRAEVSEPGPNLPPRVSSTRACSAGRRARAPRTRTPMRPSGNM